MSKMDVETFRELVGLAERAAGVTKVRIDAEPANITWLCNHKTGELTQQIATPPPYNHTLFTVPDLIEAVQCFMDQGLAPAPMVFCGREKVVVILDNLRKKEDNLTLVLPFSSEYKVLSELFTMRRSYAQSEFIKLLRIDLAGTVGTEVVNMFRKLRFSKTEDGETHIGNSRETMGRALKREVVAGDALVPDEITLRVVVYRDGDPSARRIVRCAVIVDIESASFSLIPLNGELESALRETDALIKAEFCEGLSDVPVFAGGVR